MASSKQRLWRFLIGMAGIAVLLCVWELVVAGGVVSPLALPRPSRILVELPQYLTSPGFLRNWGSTLSTWLLSLVLGLTVGLLLGFLTGASLSAARLAVPPLGYLRSIPPIALFPVALIALGPGNTPILVVAVLTATLTVFPGTMDAARVVADRYRDLARITGSSRLQFLVGFVAPGAAVHAIAASRVAATTAFIVCVAGEMIIGGRSGVGASILDATERYRLEEAYAYVLTTGVIGLVIDVGFAQIRRIRWLKAS